MSQTAPVLPQSAAVASAAPAVSPPTSAPAAVSPPSLPDTPTAPATKPALPSSPPLAESAAAPATNRVVSEPPASPEPRPPVPPPLKLQGIIFNPARPSAVVSGQTLFVGDRIREFRVVAINQESVALAGAGQTNVLALAH